MFKKKPESIVLNESTETFYRVMFNNHYVLWIVRNVNGIEDYSLRPLEKIEKQLETNKAKEDLSAFQTKEEAKKYADLLGGRVVEVSRTKQLSLSMLEVEFNDDK